MEVVGFRSHGTLYWFGDFDSLMDLVDSNKLEFNDLNYLGDDLEMKWLTGKITLEDWLKEEGFDVKVDGNKIYTSNKKEAKRLAKFLKSKKVSFEIYYSKNGKRKRHIDFEKVGLALTSASLIALAAAPFIFHEQPQLEKFEIHEGYGFLGDSINPIEVITLEGKLSHSGLELGLSNSTAYVPLCKLNDNNFNVTLFVNQTNYSVNGRLFKGHLSGDYTLAARNGDEIISLGRKVTILPPPSLKEIFKVGDDLFVKFYSKDKEFIRNGYFHIQIKKDGKTLAEFLMNGYGELTGPWETDFLNETIAINAGEYVIWKFPAMDIEIIWKTDKSYVGLETERKIYPV